MSCPFLIEGEHRCRAVIFRVVEHARGRRVEYQPLTASTVEKCRDTNIWLKCPDFLRSETIACPECGQVYLPQNAVQINIEGSTIPACPKCGMVTKRGRRHVHCGGETTGQS